MTEMTKLTILPNSTLNSNEEETVDSKNMKYPYSQKCCYEQFDLVFENQTEIVKHIKNHMKQRD